MRAEINRSGFLWILCQESNKMRAVVLCWFSGRQEGTEREKGWCHLRRQETMVEDDGAREAEVMAALG